VKSSDGTVREKDIVPGFSPPCGSRERNEVEEVARARGGSE
jgi:hypothetical protein